MSKRDRRDLNHLLGLTCQKLRSKMPANLLYREAPERAARGCLGRCGKSYLALGRLCADQRLPDYDPRRGRGVDATT